MEKRNQGRRVAKNEGVKQEGSQGRGESRKVKILEGESQVGGCKRRRESKKEGVKERGS